MDETDNFSRYRTTTVLKPDKQKKRARWVTITVNILFIAAICAVSWKIADHLIQAKESADLSERLWKQAAVTARPERTIPADAAEPDAGMDENTPVSNRDNDGAGTETAVPEEITDSTESDGSATYTVITLTKTDRENAYPSVADTAPALAVTDDMPEHAETEPAAGRIFSTDDLSEPTAAEYPDDPEAPERIDFDRLRQVSKDAYAWLYAPETGINHPVMHTYNNDYYLTHLADGTKNKAGALFIDYRNAPALLDRNTIIYGHNMKDGSMFGRLDDYQDAEYCKAHLFMYLYIPGHRFRLEVVAAATTEDASEYYRVPVSWPDWRGMLQNAVRLSAYDFGIPVNDTDHFETLSTCAYDYQNVRRIVICRVDDPEEILPKPMK